ncbi:hypothetical protein TruAng_006631 [Truncatella angustata]|nr:hypothetical protein TruAng_006631 [Truncatella angustata]
MADVLSVIASGVAVAQLAGTAGGAVLKLKRLWDQVKDVPETIRDLMEQIDCLDPALWQAEQQFAQNELPQLLWNDEAAVRSVTYCRKALGKLTELVNDLDVQINTSRRVSKKVARIKVALKKDELNKLERRLDNAVRMLQAAQQGYIITLLKLQPDIIVGKFMSCIEAAKSASNSGTIVEIDPQDDRKEVKTYSIQRKVTRKPLKSPSAVAGFRIGSSSEGLSAGFRPPWWLFGVTCAFEFNARRSLAGWDIRLRTYAVVPYNTPIWAAMSGGHVERARAIFDSRQASPFDVDELGRSLLFRAIYWCSPAILELILNLHVFSEEEVAQNIV